MPRQHHYLKSETEFYQLIEKGIKKFEIRWNDRDFQLGDIVYLHEFANGKETGRVIGPLEIDHIAWGPFYGLSRGWVIFTWKDV